MLDRYTRLARTVLQQLLKVGLPRIAQYITTVFVLSFILTRAWAAWQTPSWLSWRPDRREDWSQENYPQLESPGRQIRLLNLFPGTGAAEVEASLFAVSFLELPAYEAISYTWGGPNKTRTMTLDGKRFPVTENLWAALRAMRVPNANRTVWADAVCIDQSSVDEKSHQVGLMPFIYDRATRVLVWLAESPHADWVADAWRAQWDPVWALQEAGKDWPATAHWLRGLVDHEFWKRCWIIQEIRQARDVHIYFGDYQKHGWMPWSTFVKLAELYRSREVASPKMGLVFALQRLRRAKYVEGHSLNELLEEFGDCFCSVQLDKIYAFLGIADDDPGRYFLPDYRRSPFQLYTDLLAFHEGSEFRREQGEIEVVHFAALLRTILSRKPSSFLVKKRVAEFGVDPGSWSYQFCRRFSGSFSSQTIQSLAALLDLVSSYLQSDWESTAVEEAIWLPQDPESHRDWLPFFEKGLSKPVMARGAFAGNVMKIGSTYGAFLADPSCVNRWIRDTMGIVFANSTLLRQVVALNKKLVTVLGDAGSYRIRNFVSFRDLDAASYESYQKSRIFLGTDFGGNLIMGLVPSDTPEDAQLIQFWNSDAVLVVTRQQCRDGSVAPKAIIGRAGTVRYDSDDAETAGWDRPQQLDTFLSGSEVAVQVPMTIDVLTRLSFDTVVLPGTSGDYWYTPTLSPDDWTFGY